MKLTCSQDALHKALQNAARAISPWTSMPILSHLLLAADGAATVTGTDLELGIQSRLDASIGEPGAVALPGRLLAAIAAQLPSGAVEITVSDGGSTATIIGSGVQFEIPGLPPTDFPTMPDDAAGTPVATLSADTLLTLIRSTVFAASNDETRPFLTGVYVVIKDSAVEFVATDGGRLARRTAALTGEVPEPIAEILPARSMAELARVLGHAEDQIAIAQVDRQIVFTLPGVRLVTRVIAGKFPAYQNVIPTEFKQQLTVDTSAFMQALRRASITARDSARTVRLRSADGVLTITSNTHDVGATEERVPVEFTGEPMDIAFNAAFLLDALEAIGEPKSTLRLAGPLLPGMLTPVEDGRYTYVLAPLRVYG